MPEKLLQERERWFNGPEWAKRRIEEWPIQSSVEVCQKIDEKKEKKKDTTCCVAVKVDNLEEVIDPKKFSSLNKLLRVTAYS